MNQLEKEICELIRDLKVLGNVAEACFSFPQGFVGFKGHFPGNPILPGICLIKAFLVKLKLWQGKDIQLLEIVNAKFFAPVMPDDKLCFDSACASGEEGKCRIAETKVTCNNTKIAKIKLKFTYD